MENTGNELQSNTQEHQVFSNIEAAANFGDDHLKWVKWSQASVIHPMKQDGNEQMVGLSDFKSLMSRCKSAENSTLTELN